MRYRRDLRRFTDRPHSPLFDAVGERHRLPFSNGRRKRGWSAKIVPDGSAPTVSLLILKYLEIIMIKVYWQAGRRGQNLMLSNDDTGREQSIGGFRENAQGFDAYVTTAEYDPRNSKNGLPNIAKAKAFVESSRPWDLYGAQGAEVEPEVRPASANAEPTDEPPAAEPPPQPVATVPEPAPRSSSPSANKRWWEFWK